MEILGYVLIGLTIGFVVIQFLEAQERASNAVLRNNKKIALNKLQQQQLHILQLLKQRTPVANPTKEAAIVAIHTFAASQSLFTLKDLENQTVFLQEHYKKTIPSSTVYRTNFPEKEILPLEPVQLLALIEIVNESLHNAASYAQAAFIFNIVSIENGVLCIITHDNGIGYDRYNTPDGAGTASIKAAARSLNATLRHTSTLGNGTIVNVEVPV